MDTIPTAKPRLGSRAHSAATVPVEQLLKTLESLSLPPDKFITFQAKIWMLQVDTFRQEELAILDQADKAAHRMLVTDLIATGEAISYAAAGQGMIRFQDFTLEDFQATLESLRATLRGQHGPKNPPARAQLIDQLVHGS